jgi:hypothetical protein
MRRIILLAALFVLSAVTASAEGPDSYLTSPEETFISPFHANQRLTRRNPDNTLTSRISTGVSNGVSNDLIFQSLDLTTKRTGEMVLPDEIGSTEYIFSYNADNPGTGYRFECHDTYVRFIPFHDTTFIGTMLHPSATGVKEDLVFMGGAVPCARWRIQTNGKPSFERNELVFHGADGERVFSISRPDAFDAVGTYIPVLVTFEDSTLTYMFTPPEKTVWPVTLDPSITVTAQTDGRVQATSKATYPLARDASSGDAFSSFAMIGQQYDGAYSLYRSFLAFPIPELGQASACTLFVYSRWDQSLTDFDIYAVSASAYRSSLDDGDYTRFDGQQTGAALTGINLIDAWPTSSYQTGYNALVFNTTGLDSIEAAAGDTIWIALLSSRDYADIPPLQNEFVMFESSAHETAKPYLSLTYSVNETTGSPFKAVNDGRIRSITSAGYQAARDTLAGNADGNWIQAGQFTIGSNYHVYRGFLSFPLPEMYTISACTLYVKGLYDYSTDSEFDLSITGADAYGSTLQGDDFPRFEGHQSGSPHTGIILNQSWNSVSFTTGWNGIVFNPAGLDSIRAASGDTLRIAILSAHDYSNTPPSGSEYVVFQSSATPGSEPYLALDYQPGLIPPASFVMTAIDDSTIVCTWSDIPGESAYHVVSWPDTTIIHTLPANTLADTIIVLSPNTLYRWAVLADSAGVTGLSLSDSCYTLLPPPARTAIRIMPIGSDTLSISVIPPPNGASGLTGFEVNAVSGPGISGSDWLTGIYRHLDGGLDCDSTYIYRARFRNGDGIPSGWSDDLSYAMNGLTTMVIPLSGDNGDDFTVNNGPGQKDSTVVRAGRSSATEQFDGFLSFVIPWSVQKGGVDSLFISLCRTPEDSLRIPALVLASIPGKHLAPIETIDPSIETVSLSTVTWIVSPGIGVRISPNLRPLFREWQDIEPINDHPAMFGLKLGGENASSGEQAVFLDASAPEYYNDTFLTVFFTPGSPDSLDAAPDRLSLVTEGPDSVTARWADNSTHELGFIILNATDASAVTDTLAENTMMTGIGGLLPNTVHQWFVRAFSAVDDSSSETAETRTAARTPGMTTVSPLSDSTLSFTIDPLDNPSSTRFAVQDSITGLFIDATGIQDTLRTGYPGEWAWRTFDQWGGGTGRILTGLDPDSLFVLRAKARDGE